MAEKSSFFNSVNGDRRYKAEEFAGYFNKFITNGYFPNIGTNLQVIADGTNMNVTVKSGAAWINGYMYHNNSDLILPIEVADGVLNRIDRIVVRCDFKQRLIKSVVKKGVFASVPVPVDLQRDADAYELCVAEIRVNKGVISINQTVVTDTRLNTSLCGVVNSLLQADTTVIFNQYQDWFSRKSVDYEQEFKTWFDSIKGQLEGDVAANLTNKVIKLESDMIATNKKIEPKLSTIKKNKVGETHTLIEFKTKENKLYKSHELSGLEGELYKVQTVKFYDDLGVVIPSQTLVYDIVYDSDGNWISEVLRNA